MSTWYYAENHRQRQGPLATENLIASFHSRRIGFDTLVWRKGQEQWQPLGHFAKELGIVDEVTPLHTRPAFTARTVRQAPNSSNRVSGGVLALIVVCVLAIPVAGILAAIIIPSYQQYVGRAKVAALLAGFEPMKKVVADFQQQRHTCPSNSDIGARKGGIESGRVVISASMITFESGRCGVEIRFIKSGSAKLDGKAVWLDFDSTGSHWTCSSEIDDEYLPAQCRG